MGSAEMVVRGMSHRADDGRSIECHRRQRQLFTKDDPRQLGLNGRVRPSNLDRCMRLGIERFKLTGTSSEPNLNHCGIGGRSPLNLCDRLLSQNVCQRKSRSASKQTGLQETSASVRGGSVHRRLSIDKAGFRLSRKSGRVPMRRGSNWRRSTRTTIHRQPLMLQCRLWIWDSPSSVLKYVRCVELSRRGAGIAEFGESWG